MSHKIPVFFLFILVAFFSLANAQKKSDADALKQKQFKDLTEQIITEIPNLKLGENRALLYAKIGGLVRKNDKKNAYVLYQNAVSELIGAQNEAESNSKNRNHYNSLINGQTPRTQILRIIAAQDAEFALNFLYQTRPAIVSKSVALRSVKSNKISSNEYNYDYLAQNEFNLEQTFISLAAEQNPERAVKLLEESLKKGFSSETLNLLKKLNKQDSEKATAMAGEIISKLIQSKFIDKNQPNQQNLNIAVSLLTEFAVENPNSEPKLKINSDQIQNLANALINFYLEKAAQYNNLHTYSIVRIAEKFAPAKVESLKNLRKGNSRGFVANNDYQEEINKVLSNETSPEQMVAEARKFPVNLRGSIYQSAANKSAAGGNLTGALGLLNENFEDVALEDAVRNLYSQYAYNLISEEKFTEAENLLNNFPEDSRINSYILLANAVYQKNPKENKSQAIAILAKARASISVKPENSPELNLIMQIIQSCTQIDASEAMTLYEPLIPQMNELSEAAAVIHGFQSGNNVRQGEFSLAGGDSYGFYGADFSVFQIFAKNDFNRTINLINMFTRSEIRLSLKIQIAESLSN